MKLLFLVMLQAHASSFECSKAQTATEKLICAKPELSAQDDAMAAAYKALLSKMPKGQQAWLKHSQRDWIELREKECALESPPEGCLTQALNFRKKELESLGKPGKWIPITLQLPADWKKFRQAVADSDGSQAKVAFAPYHALSTGTDPVKESAVAAGRYMLRSSQDPEAYVEFRNVKNGEARVMLHMEGWAGSSFTAVSVQTVVEKTLLQFPQVKRVIWESKP